ncbi:hypothetical protein PVAND_000678 [Polypedilum vanderplanki]|uniref:Uncharacterized protein n=1 Tax=Polypedilum vanderplanki TaxID=319348 RepID=A0A9J6BKX1_POLVA|nr:hypothetical protein PVAND_000678 [Polypedilum vanderplanki]
MFLKTLFFLCIICCSQILIEGKCDDYYCTSDPWKCILKGFESVEEIDDFCNRRSVFEYTDINGNINTTSNLQCHIIEFQNISMTCLPSACFTKFTSISELYANNTGIELIKDDDFQNLRYLQILNLSGNKIDTFKNLWFQYSGSLREIDFSYNQIKDLDLNISDVSVWNNLMKIDFSYNKIKKFNEQILQKYFKTTQYSNRKVSILLNNNQIEKFISTEENCEILYGQQSTLELNLTYNSLKSIESKCDITVLDISNNQLEEFKSNAKNVIADNNTIKSLTLYTNVNSVSLKNNNLQLLDDYVSLLSSLENITELDISNNTFEDLKLESFAEMTNLKKLSLSNVGLTEVPFGLFAHSKNVEMLDLSYNKLKLTLNLLKFSAMENLKTLNISGNSLNVLENYEIIKKIIPTLQSIGLEDNNWECKTLSLMKISFNFDRISLIDPYCTSDPWKCILKGFESVEEIEDFCNGRSVFEYTDINGNINTASGSQFRTIDFQNVSTTRLPSACFTKFTSISELYANNTGIEIIEDDDFQNLRSLQILNLSGNKIGKFKNLSFQFSGNLREIDFSHNQIEELDNFFHGNSGNNLVKIDFSYNKIKKFDEQKLRNIFNTREYSNKIISFNHNQIEQYIPAVKNCIIMYPTPSTLTLNFTYNSLKSIESKCDITVLDISNNQLEEVKANATKIIADNNEINLITVYTNVKRVSLKNNHVITLSSFENVLELDISNNTLNIPKLEMFADMRNLKKLSLSNVGLTEVPYGLFAHSKKGRDVGSFLQ